jgi:glycosyltransferase involved in cell wall biosynthesis
MIRILTIAEWYLPGFKAGGPVRSLSNLISALGHAECEFFVLTRDRDIGDSAPFLGVATDTWVPFGKGQVFYTADTSMANLRRRIAEISPDIIYLNSFFSRLTVKILLLRRLGLLPPAAVVLAPRGEFSPGALALKTTKKRVFMGGAALAGLYGNVLWHASTQREKREMENIFAAFPLNTQNAQGIAGPIHVASDMADAQPEGRGLGLAPTKESGRVSFVFISRISLMKNLIGAIELVSALSGEVVLDIYGPVEDPRYFAFCQQTIAKVPANVNIRYMGALPHEQARQKFSEYHFFLFPTLGENFGHVIVESLAAGCPAVISDQTPWQGLEDRNAGWTVPLENKEAWRKVLQSCVDMDNAAFARMSTAARRFAQEVSLSPTIREENLNLFRHALAPRNPEGESMRSITANQ